jgi:hypothetical protein
VQNLSEASKRDVLYIPGSSVPTTPEPNDAPRTSSAPSWSEVPWRTILGTVGVVVATYALIVVLLAAQRILMWILLAGSWPSCLPRSWLESIAASVGAGRSPPAS